ncbi:MAG: bifunctional diguanylate cyclase/phosphodiesterase [Epsilonproteobacteria bacterium]|nr:bifunctional diguanylate cyclase/phosphodiesterase [Campylobacterota bacterium]
MKRVLILFTLFLLSIFVAIFYLYHKMDVIHRKISENVETLFINEAGEFSRNVEGYLKRLTGSDYPVEKLMRNPNLRTLAERALGIIITPTIKYVYIVYKDEDGHYRYLVDGSREDRGEFGEPINVDEPRWRASFLSGKPTVLSQKNLEKIWGTYLYPLKGKKGTDAVVAIDFSMNLPRQINGASRPMQMVFLYIFVAIGLFIFLLAWQTFLLFKTRKISMHDALTGAYNRTFLQDFLNGMDPARYHLLMIDLDHFKQINDTYGHKAGDLILKGFAERVRRLIRNKDTLIRYGGEEFLIFLRRKDGDEVPEIVAERIRTAVADAPFFFEKEKIHLTVSVGLIEKPERYKSPNLAVKAADQMLYRAKRTGRNKVVSDREEATLPYDQEREITLYTVRHALEEGRVVCHYQPIFDLRNGKPVKYEALVRIVDRERYYTPADFLPLIAHTTLYADVTKRVLQSVFNVMERSDYAISVNLELTDILDNKIYDILIAQLKKNRALAHRLIVELLENEPYDSDELVRRLKEIRQFGTRIALDDFGSGYANFALFQKINIDILKIDGSLVKSASVDMKSYNIVISIQQFANRLGIETVAEYIHDEATLRIMRDAGVTFGQGHYLGAPFPVPDGERPFLNIK